MKLFKRISIINEGDVCNYIDDERIIRLANTVVIDLEDELLFVKYEGKEEFDIINSSEFYVSLCDKKFITIPQKKRLSPQQILDLYDSNVRILAEPKPPIGMNVFRMHLMDKPSIDDISDIY